MSMFFVGEVGEPGEFVVPAAPPLAERHAPNFERFDGLGTLDNAPGLTPEGVSYFPSPRPGQANQPQGQVYTKGPLSGVVGAIGGQPLPVDNWLYRTGRGYTQSQTPTIQFRRGVGQNYQGAAQTVHLSELSNNPPVPGDLTSIIAGWG